ncbi:MAG: hypothetical protein FK733_15785 [Asgard group archaeon]|nr:hypothetical protein [Asgard group archaeon]
MVKDKFGGTIRFKELMEKNVKRLKNLANLTQEMIEQSIVALKEDKVEIYEEIASKLNTIKEYRVSLEKNIINSVTLHQPFARDLRFLISSLKIANELERTARDAIHIAHSSKYVDRTMKSLKDVVDKICDLASKALFMYTESIKYFLARKVVDSDKWTALDDEVDETHKEIIEEITSIMDTQCESTRAGVSLILTTRYIERIADHACNISEESTFVATSKRNPID